MFDMGWSFEIIVFKGHSDVKNILDTTYAELEINTTDFNDFNTLIVLRQKCTSKRFCMQIPEVFKGVKLDEFSTTYF